MWVIYRPIIKDFPGRWVTRIRVTLPADKATWFVMTHDTLDNLRPDRCQVVIDASANGQDHHVRCDPSRRDAWQQQEVQALISSLVEQDLGDFWLVEGNMRRRIRLNG